MISTYKRPINEQVVLNLAVCDAARRFYSASCNCEPTEPELLAAMAALESAILEAEDPQCEVQVASKDSDGGSTG